MTTLLKERFKAHCERLSLLAARDESRQTTAGGLADYRLTTGDGRTTTGRKGEREMGRRGEGEILLPFSPSSLLPFSPSPLLPFSPSPCAFFTSSHRFRRGTAGPASRCR